MKISLGDEINLHHDQVKTIQADTRSLRTGFPQNGNELLRSFSFRKGNRQGGRFHERKGDFDQGFNQGSKTLRVQGYFQKRRFFER